MGSTGTYVNGEIGYNKENVEAIKGEINNIAKETGEKIIQQLKDCVVTPISTAWYSEVAVTYFENFQQIVKSKEQAITDVFQEFTNKIQEAGSDWAETAGGEAPVLGEIDTVALDLDVSEILDQDSNGSRFIVDGLRDTVSQGVDTAKESVSRFIEAMATNVDVSLAFLGGGQSEAINAAAIGIKDQVDGILNYLVEGDESLVDAIDKFNQEYSSTAEGNVAKFSDSQFNNVQ